MEIIDSHVKAVAAAFLGGIISKRFRREMSRKAWLAAVFLSCCMSYIISVPLAVYLDDVNSAGPIGLFVGLFGLAICEKIYETIDEVDLAAIIKKRLGGE